MKKQLLLIGLVLAICTGYSQEIDDEMVTKTDSMVVDSVCHHRLLFHVGSGWNNNIYHRVPGIKSVYSIGDVFEFGYSYFFNEHWGLGLGVGLHHIAAKADMNFEGCITKFYDPQFPENAQNKDVTYDYWYRTNNMYERQRILAIEIPLTVQYEHRFNDRHGIYAMLGAKAYIPIYNKSWVTRGTINTWGYEEFFNVLYDKDHCLNHGFSEFEVSGANSTKLRCSVDLQADFGGIFRINNKADFYLGAWCSYGFLDVLPKAETRHDYIGSKDGNIVYNGLLGSTHDINYDRAAISGKPADPNSTYTSISKDEVIGNFKWNNLQVGLKLGIHVKPCGRVEPSARKKFYQKMTEAAEKYLNDTCNTCDKNKNVEYIYIVPVCPDRNERGEKLSKKDKQGLQDLAGDLENIKILFDLDKDVPKINQNGDFVDKCVAKLKANPTWHLTIEGYTCSLGSEEHNRDLAQRRAESIKRMFVQKGVNPDQLEVKTYTANDPENSQNITDPAKEEHRAAIIRIKVQ